MPLVSGVGELPVAFGGSLDPHAPHVLAPE